LGLTIQNFNRAWDCMIRTSRAVVDGQCSRLLLRSSEFDSDCSLNVSLRCIIVWNDEK